MNTALIKRITQYPVKGQYNRQFTSPNDLCFYFTNLQYRKCGMDKYLRPLFCVVYNLVIPALFSTAVELKRLESEGMYRKLSLWLLIHVIIPGKSCY